MTRLPLNARFHTAVVRFRMLQDVTALELKTSTRR